ncbi:hemerythrin domain-containing protein [Cohnella panacarvi]|uniref:hemerythrin domain-containing protein n=1 Tax=Cohnella panacarvi TaxID=400776 RepID=UPI00047D4287|nr:hemerythrin domain-containing protein [Cohnella panacarvi]
MDQPSFGCGGMSDGAGALEIALCAPLQLLWNEHAPLRAMMDTFNETAQKVMTYEGSLLALFNLLREQVAAFTLELKAHARKEDDVLFPMMAAHIGREFGPIAVMEHEHVQAEMNLERFLEAAGPDGTELDDEEAKFIAGYAAFAYSILTQHFNKEENVLFPMAERMLSEEEKARLAGLLS